MVIKRILVVLLLVALVASIALNVALYSRGRDYYLQLNDVRLDPLGLKQHPVGSSAAPGAAAAGQRVVFFGDSRAEHWPAPDVEGFEYANRGVSNQTTAQILARYGEHVAPLAPQVVVIQAGVNDLKAIPLFPDRKGAIVAACQANIEQIVTQARAQGATVILTTIFPLGQVPPERRLFWSDEVGDAIREVNAGLRSLEGPGIIVLDSRRVLAGEQGTVQAQYSKDLLHLQAAGYRALNEELGRILEGLDLD